MSGWDRSEETLSRVKSIINIIEKAKEDNLHWKDIIYQSTFEMELLLDENQAENYKARPNKKDYLDWAKNGEYCHRVQKTLKRQISNCITTIRVCQKQLDYLQGLTKDYSDEEI